MTKLFVATDVPQNMDQGPLASIVTAYAALLCQQGFTRQYARLQLRFVADLNQWLLQHRLQIIDLCETTFHEYLRSRHQRFRPRRDDQSILRRLVQLLHTQGLLPNEAPASLADPHQSVEDDFDRYLAAERGLSMATRINYRPFVHRFLSAQSGDKPVRLADLNAEDVSRFIRNQAPGLSPKRAGLLVSALRSFFRFLRHRGDIALNLAACVPPIANWQFSSLPKFLQPHQVQQVLGQCDRRTARGRRDYAILLLL